jgi:DNA polymerase III delta prime subunit
MISYCFGILLAQSLARLYDKEKIMKKLISQVTLCALLLTTSPIAAATTQVDPTKKTLDGAFNLFKTSVFLEGKDYGPATTKLVNQLIDSKVTSAELELYVAKHATPEGHRKFQEMMTIALEDVESMQDLGQEEIAFILKRALQKTSPTGSNFMSCKIGVGVGVPLIAVGVIMGIVSIANATASKEAVTQEIISRKRNTNDDYLNTLADLEFERSTYESDIIYYQDEIDELQRRIDSGLYSAIQVEEMYKLKRDYEFFISDSVALISEVEVDINFFENEYNAEIALLDNEETSLLAEVDEKHARAGKLAVAAGIIGGVGAVFTATGSSDCN